jgi:hypothetical protein
VFTARYGLSPYITHTFRLVFITEVDSVYSAVRTESLYGTVNVSFLKGYMFIRTLLDLLTEYCTVCV